MGHQCTLIDISYGFIFCACLVFLKAIECITLKIVILKVMDVLVKVMFTQAFQQHTEIVATIRTPCSRVINFVCKAIIAVAGCHRYNSRML